MKNHRQRENFPVIPTIPPARMRMLATLAARRGFTMSMRWPGESTVKLLP
jgi:hypothetical protein